MGNSISAFFSQSLLRIRVATADHAIFNATTERLLKDDGVLFLLIILILYIMIRETEHSNALLGNGNFCQ